MSAIYLPPITTLGKTGFTEQTALGIFCQLMKELLKEWSSCMYSREGSARPLHYVTCSVAHMKIHFLNAWFILYSEWMLCTGFDLTQLIGKWCGADSISPLLCLHSYTLTTNPGQCKKFRFRKVPHLDEIAVWAWMCTHAHIMHAYVQNKRITFPLWLLL